MNVIRNQARIVNKTGVYESGGQWFESQAQHVNVIFLVCKSAIMSGYLKKKQFSLVYLPNYETLFIKWFYIVDKIKNQF